jgi:PAS domain-containing protein
LFVAWNSKFLELTGYSEEEIKSSGLEDLLAFGESWISLSTESQRVEYIACTAQRRTGADPAPGVAVRAHDKIGYIMLDVFDTSAGQFAQGRNVGREEERDRIVRTFHEEVSSSIIAALFLIETAKSELQDAGSPQAEMVSKASEILTQTTEKIADVLGPSEQNAS